MTRKSWAFFFTFFLSFTISTFADELKVVTINVWSGLDYEGTLKMGEYEPKDVRKGRYRLLVDELKRIDPDIIGINEANRLPRYARRLARDLGMNFIYSVGMGGIKIGCIGLPVNFREGDAILAKKKYNLKFLGRKRLSGGGIINNLFTFHFSEANQVMGGFIKVSGKYVYIFNTHTHSSPPGDEDFTDRLVDLHNDGRITEEDLKKAKDIVIEGAQWRNDEIRGVLLWISEIVPDNASVILLGDFNAEAGSAEMKQVFKAGFIDTFRVKNPKLPGYTWDPVNNLNIQTYYSRLNEDTVQEEIAGKLGDFLQKRIDFIFISGSLSADDVAESSVIFDRAEGGQNLSDHYGVLSVIRIE